MSILHIGLTIRLSNTSVFLPRYNEQNDTRSEALFKNETNVLNLCREMVPR